MFERELREVAHVKRWAIVRTSRDQNVAEHSYFVAMYANDIALSLNLGEEVQMAVLRKALWHDVDEIFTGDIAGPHKRHVVDVKKMKETLSKWTSKVFGVLGNRSTVLGLDLQQQEVVNLVVKAADILESVLFLCDEIQMGNATVANHKRPLMESFEKTMISIPAVLQGIKEDTFHDIPIDAESELVARVRNIIRAAENAEAKHTVGYSMNTVVGYLNS